MTQEQSNEVAVAVGWCRVQLEVVIWIHGHVLQSPQAPHSYHRTALLRKGILPTSAERLELMGMGRRVLGDVHVRKFLFGTISAFLVSYGAICVNFQATEVTSSTSSNSFCDFSACINFTNLMSSCYNDYPGEIMGQ
ncbi:hypothetical protein NPIL_137591 [Nephila pilipes]|uniref:Uncharacterized protein n=1 Tax=Nephila pilipes TaxID=299642 RepID=A0A8X6N2T9_NEPPI|nr:hypothetical protein NPIL_137591 [Nephila pilipes]